jgi:radical SAM superfamily enzyme YgiQ (UPF0313 family)
MTGSQILSGLEVIKFAKRTSTIPVVWGGLHATSLPEQTVTHSLIDWVVQGEGEIIFPQLLERFAQRLEGPFDIPGVYRKVNGRVVGTRQNQLIDVNATPMLPYHLIDLHRYIWEWDYGRGISIFSSRGCPFRCTFCVNTAYNQSRWRGFSPARVYAEVEFLVAQHHIEHIQFLDDNYFVSKKRALDIANLFLVSALNFTWSVLGGHVNNLIVFSEEELSMLYASGLRTVGIGVEAGSEKILQALRKNIVLEDLSVLNRRLRNAKIVPFYSYVSGLPGETDEDLHSTLRLMLRLKQDNPDSVIGNIKPLMYYPGTTIYADIVKRGFAPPASLEEWGSYNVSNYERITYPWLTRRRRIFLVHLYYVTLLLNPRYIFIKSKIYRFIAAIYHPVAMYRARHFDFRFLLLARIFRYVHKFILWS